MIYWACLFAAVMFNIVSVSSLKSAVTGIEMAAPGRMVGQLLSVPAFWVGIVFAGLLLTSFLVAIRGLPLSITYALVTSLSMVGMTVSGAIFFGEALTVLKFAGVLLIIGGVVILSRFA